MKTFFATFAAILCAAGVIWGVAVTVESRKAERARQATDLREMLVSAANVAMKSQEMLCNAPRLDLTEERSERWLGEARAIAEYLKSSPTVKIDREGREAVLLYSQYWGYSIAECRREHPRWAQEMTDLVSEIETEAAKH